MKKYTILLTFITCMATVSRAQQLKPADTYIEENNAVYVEFAGQSGLGASINYERLFKVIKSVHLRASVGLGESLSGDDTHFSSSLNSASGYSYYSSKQPTISKTVIPVSTGVIFGKNRRHVEIRGGYTANSAFPIDVSIGFRYQKEGFVLKGMGVLFFENEILPEHFWLPRPWAGFSIGHTF